jgi:hypothetical protein
MYCHQVYQIYLRLYVSLDGCLCSHDRVLLSSGPDKGHPQFHQVLRYGFAPMFV